MNKKKKNKIKTIILIITSSLLLSIFTISLVNILNWNKNNIDNKKIVEEINKTTEVTEVKNNNNTEFVNKPLDDNDDYWYYASFDFIDVNLNKLKQKNNDTIGWLQVNNTSINYPFVQSSNNDYYLYHSFDKTNNNAGWIFLDYRNNKELKDKNNIIYGHHRINNTMFTTLLNFLNNDWSNSKDNNIIKISLENENSIWQVISSYKIKAESYYITTNFSSDEEFINFLNTIKERSIYDYGYIANKDDTILTLSTCYDDYTRMVVHAKLIKTNKK